MNKLLFALLLMTFAACADPAATTTAPADVPIPPVTSAPVVTNNVAYPSIPQEKIENIFLQADYIDYVFYDLPFSMNHGEKADVQNAIRYISTTPVTADIPQCPSIGRIFYQSKGKIIGEAEFHFDEKGKCFYLIFLEDGQPKYGNLLTTNGMQNYKNIFAKVVK